MVGRTSSSFSAHPQENTGIGFSARSYVHIFRSPEFDAEEVAIHKLGSIGSGSSFGPCLDAIERYASDNSHRMMFVGGESTSGGMGSMLGLSLTDILIRTEPRWVSSHLHYCWVYRGNIIVKTNDHRRKGRWSVAELGAGVEQNAASSAWAQDADAEHLRCPRLPQAGENWWNFWAHEERRRGFAGADRCGGPTYPFRDHLFGAAARPMGDQKPWSCPFRSS